MNKYQYALDFLSEYSLGCAVTNHKDKTIITISNYTKLLQELVDKETPIKPVRKGKLNWWHCPCCDISLYFDNQPRCQVCGQKLGSDECE